MPRSTMRRSPRETPVAPSSPGSPTPCCARLRRRASPRSPPHTPRTHRDRTFAAGVDRRRASRRRAARRTSSRHAQPGLPNRPRSSRAATAAGSRATRSSSSCSSPVSPPRRSRARDMALRLDGLGGSGAQSVVPAGPVDGARHRRAARRGHVAAPRAGQRILDACAGVGGKATHLAELADDAAVIDAADRSQVVFSACSPRRRLGSACRASDRTCAICSIATRRSPPRTTWIVVDAPCSGLGVLRRHPDAKWRLQPNDVPRLAQLQRELLDALVPRLAFRRHVDLFGVYVHPRRGSGADRRAVRADSAARGRGGPHSGRPMPTRFTSRVSSTRRDRDQLGALAQQVP